MERKEAHRAVTRGEWRNGWRVVAAGMVGIGCGPGLYQNLSSMFAPGMIAEFGWTRGALATAVGVGLLGALGVPLLGRIGDRTGPRLLIAGAMLLLAAAFIGFANLHGGLASYSLLVALLSLSVAGTSAMVYGPLIVGRFVRHRGLALGVATSGISPATLLLSPLVGWIIAAYGWRAGFLALGGLTALVALPAVLLLLRGADTAPAAAAPAAAAGPRAAAVRRDGRFWRLAASGALVNIGCIGLLTSLVPIGLERGLTAGQAALLISAFGASEVVGRLSMGALVDRWRAQYAAASFAALSALAFAGLLLPAPGLPAMLALVFVAGLMYGSEYDLLPFLTVRLFGLRAYGESYGTLLTVALFGTAAGVVAFGRLYDATGGYGAALALGGAALGIAAILFLTLREDAPPASAA